MASVMVQVTVPHAIGCFRSARQNLVSGLRTSPRVLEWAGQHWSCSHAGFMQVSVMTLVLPDLAGWSHEK